MLGALILSTLKTENQTTANAIIKEKEKNKLNRELTYSLVVIPRYSTTY